MNTNKKRRILYFLALFLKTRKKIYLAYISSKIINNNVAF